MKAINAIVLVGLVMFAGLAYADELLGFYAGAAVGAASSSNEVPSPILMNRVNSSTIGWSVYTGIRPLHFVGVELNYIDFGNAKATNVTDGNGDTTYEATAKNTAVTGFVVGYLPLLPAHWDIFAKAGYSLATTKTNTSGNYPNVCGVGLVCQPIGTASYSTTRNSNDFAYGVGTQYRFGWWSMRVEYQKITVSAANPDMFSLGVSWNF